MYKYKWDLGRGRGILTLVCTLMDCIFPIVNENLFSSQRSTYFILRSEFWISLHNDRNRPILDNCEDEIIKISLYSSHLKGEAVPPRLLVCLKYNKYIHHKLVLEKRKNRYHDNPIKAGCTNFFLGARLFGRGKNCLSKWKYTSDRVVAFCSWSLKRDLRLSF